MKTRCSKLPALRWSLTITAALLLILEAVSAQCHFGWTRADHALTLSVRNGTLCIAYIEPPPPGFAYGGGGPTRPKPAPGWWTEPLYTRQPKWDPEWLFLPRLDTFPAGPDFILWLPIAAPALAATLPAAFLWWPLLRPLPRRWRLLSGKCPTCNYDLRGLPRNSKCPECGKVSTS